MNAMPANQPSSLTPPPSEAPHPSSLTPQPSEAPHPSSLTLQPSNAPHPSSLTPPPSNAHHPSSFIPPPSNAPHPSSFIPHPSTDVLVRVEHVSKKFCKSLKGSLWYGVKDMASELLPFARHRPPTPRPSSLSLPPSEAPHPSAFIPHPSNLRPGEFWAVTDVSFELRRGECLGLIGHNGAGKSTLLRMLCGLIKPNTGRIEMRGRVSALIELSAGFNPILTGRENIYNRGALLGLSKREMDRQFPEIVAFAGIGDFLDMPVQNYSSGMRIRLGFSVSVFVQPDILLIDEVLAVGDLGFIIKCLNKMSELMQRSAVVFVSHSMPMVARICTQTLLMEGGRQKYAGNDVPFAIEQYTQLFETGGRAAQGSGEIVINRVGIRASNNNEFVFDSSFVHENGQPLQLRLEFEVKRSMQNDVNLFILILDQQLREIVNCLSEENSEAFAFHNPRHVTVDVCLPDLYLNRGKHTITVGASDCETQALYCRTTNAATLLVRSKVHGWGTNVIPGKWNCVEQQ